MSAADHVSLPVPTHLLDAEIAFLLASLGPLGLKEIMRPAPFVVGMGKDKPWLWVSSMGTGRKELTGDVTSIHLAVVAASRKEVDAFHAAALKAGGKDYGAPGLRTEYHPDYYAAFVLSPAGHNIEAVVHCPEA